MNEVENVRQPRKAVKRYRYKKLAGLILQFVTLYIFWLVLSGRYEIEYLAFGVLAAAFIAFLNHELLSLLWHTDGKGETQARVVFRQLWRFLAYLPWLLVRIIIANVHVAYLVLHPKMPIKPALLQFQTRLQGNLSQVIVANSITLTPGTVTVKLEDGEYVIHVLVPSSASGILKAEIQNKVGAIFMEKKEKPPVVLWANSIGNLKQ